MSEMGPIAGLMDGPIAGPGGEPDSRYLIAIGLSGEPTARVKGSGGPQKKNS